MSVSAAAPVSRLFILKLHDALWTRGLESTLRKWQPAGVIVPARQGRSERVLADLFRRVDRTLDAPPFLGLAGEPSQQDPLRKVFPIAADFPGPQEVVRRGVKAAGILGALRGLLLRRLGATVDLWLSLDLAPEGAANIRGTCNFGSDPREVAKLARAYLRGLRAQGILACAGDFPGLASAQTQPGMKMLVSSKPMAELWRADLVPFRELLPHLPLVAISHAAYKAYDFDVPRPAMLSSEVVSGLLRVKLEYRGIALANLPALAGTESPTDFGSAAAKAFEAGCDVFILPLAHEVLEQAVRVIAASIEAERVAGDRITESLRRIRAAKRKIPQPRRGLAPEGKQLAAEARKLLKGIAD